MSAVTVAEVDEDGHTLKLSLPDTVVRQYHLLPGAKLSYAFLPDGRIMVSLAGDLAQLGRAVLDIMCDTEGPTAEELVDASRRAQRHLGEPK